MRLDRYDQGGYAGGGITENGGNISGPLVLAGNPSQTLEAVPKQYVDAYFNSLNASNLTAGTLAAARLPNFTGDLQSVAGTSQLTLANSGITPGEYGKVTVNAKGIVTSGGDISDTDIPFGLGWEKINPTTLPSTLAGYGITDGVSINGGTMIGFLTISQSPTLGSHIATKQYVDSLISSGGIAVGDILRKPYSTTPAGFLKCNGAEVDKTAYANLYSVIGDQYIQNTVPGNGKPWEQQYQINSTQNDNLNTFISESNLTFNFGVGAWAVTKNRVYLFAGVSNTTPTSAVYTAAINTDGTLGTWSSATALPVGMGYMDCIVTKNKLYILGGSSGNGITLQLNSVYLANINSDGTLGNWISVGNLPGVFVAGQAIITKNRVYLFGGNDINSNGVTNTYTAPINSDGTLGAWVTGPSLVTGVYWSKVAVIKNRVYLFGGTLGPNNNTNTIQSAIINFDGTIGSWSVVGTLPAAISHSKLYISKNKIYLLGGHTGSSYLTSTYFATINTDGSLGTWLNGPDLPSNIIHNALITTKNRIYLLGGYYNGTIYNNVYSCPINGGLNDYSAYYSEDITNYMMPGSGRPWEQQYQINNLQTTNITNWVVTTSLPAAIAGSQAVVTKNRVYLLGGNNGTTAISTVYTAPINSDGTLGTWTTGTSLPGILNLSQAIVTKNYVYLLGGHNGTTYTASVYRCNINADGTLGTWNIITSLPGTLGHSQAIITKNRIYLLGGCDYNNNGVNSIYTAPINADGTLGTWSSSGTIPQTKWAAKAFVTKNRVYLAGGWNGAALSTVHSASINSDGLIGTWKTEKNLPVNLVNSSVIVFNKKVFILGSGTTTLGTSISSVYTANILSDGTLDSWTISDSLPDNSCYMAPFIVKDRIYLCGRINGVTTYPSVYMASILGGENDYSPYYDGTITAAGVPDNSTKFVLPDLTSDEPFGSYSYIKY